MEQNGNLMDFRHINIGLPMIAVTNYIQELVVYTQVLTLPSLASISDFKKDLWRSKFKTYGVM